MTWMSPNHYRTIDNVQRPLAESFGKVAPTVLVLRKPVRIERRMVRALVCQYLIPLGEVVTAGLSGNDTRDRVGNCLRSLLCWQQEHDMGRTVMFSTVRR